MNIPKEAFTSDNTLDRTGIREYEERLGIKFGDQLKDYLTNGFIVYGPMYLFGINPKVKFYSNLIEETEYIHKYFPETNGLVAIEDQGEADYYLVDSNDNVFEYITETEELINMKISLEDYIEARIKSVESIMDE